MIKLQTKGQPVYHRLTATKDLKGMSNGETKDVLIQKMSDGRFCVMGLFKVLPGNPEPIYSFDYFYLILNTESELHETFEEAKVLVA